MLSFKTFNRTLVILKPISRPFSQQVANSTAAKVTESIQQAETVRYPYFVPRNTRGSLPVYSDIRNGGTRYLVILEDVKGDINALKNDILSTLFDSESEQANKMKAVVGRNNKIVITGGRWKHHVMDWLSKKGF